MLAPLQAALTARGYDTLTPVQEAVADPALEQADLLVSAQTGSGKTVAFGLALGPTLLGGAKAFDTAAAPLGLIVTPTRELALQVARELRWLYAETGAKVVTTVGGMDMRDERRALDRGAHLVVATPGRLRDHIARSAIDLSAVRGVVLDEADEMLDLGFAEDLEFILGSCPEDRRTLLFSATVPPSIKGLARQYQRDAQQLNVAGGAQQHADIAYQAMMVANHDVDAAVINTLRFHDAPNAIVFCNTRAMVGRLTARLSNRGFAVVALSGELTQSERTNALQAMRDGRARVCVATDVAARGIDLPGLDLVVHAELPSSHETLLHRSGRTGRAGRKGTSALIVTARTRGRAMRALKGAKVFADWIDAPSAEAVNARDFERLIDDPMWTDDATEAEVALAKTLSDRFDPAALALAVARLHSGRHSAPEHLSDVAAPAQKERAPFGPSVWFEVTGGRAQGVEVRRLLPQICNAGDITKDEIGAIRLQDDTSLVEVKQSAADAFTAALGPDKRLEDGGVVTRLDGVPEGAQRSARPMHKGKPRDTKPYPDKRGPHKPAKDRSRASYDPDKASPPKPRAPKAPSRMEKALDDGAVTSPTRSARAKPEGKAPRKPVGKPPARAAGKAAPKPERAAAPRPAGAPRKPSGPKLNPKTGKPLAPKVGKPNSKKNKARRAAGAAAQGGSQPPRRKS